MTSKTKKILSACAAVVVVVLGLAYWTFFTSFSGTADSYIYISKGDTPDSVYAKIERSCDACHMAGLKFCAALLNYKSHIHEGRYATGDGVSTFRLVRNLRSGRQAPVKLVIPVVHTMNDLAGRLSLQLQTDSATLARAFRDASLLKGLDVDTASVPCLFIPNTYEVYWNITPEKLLRRMKKEHDAYWTDARKSQAKAASLTPDEVYTLASIVEQESTNEQERPLIAGMYLNRLHQGMKLQADPTVKFALGNFSLRRILINHLSVDSRYNTYRYEGLPLGPICIPSLNAIESVLNYAHHNYIYMCAKEDFSGTHNFAATYEEHQANAKRYAQALNERGVK